MTDPRSSAIRGSVIVMGLITQTVAQSQPLPIVNAGFEADVITPGAFAVLIPQGWTTYDPGFIINQNANSVGVIRPDVPQSFFPAGAPEGVNAALVFLAGGQTAEAGLQQTLSATLQANTRYRCSVQVGNIASGTSLPGSADGGGVFYNLAGFPGYRIDILAGTTVVASDNNSIGATIPEGEFLDARFYFDATNGHPQLGQNLGIRLVNLNAPGTTEAPNIEVDFDDVRLTTGPIPAPAELSIALVGDSPTLGISGTTGATYRVEYALSLPATNWITLTNLFVPTSPQILLDAHSQTNAGHRFYRAVVVE
jgi:hypothetical protein